MRQNLCIFHRTWHMIETGARNPPGWSALAESHDAWVAKVTSSDQMTRRSCMMPELRVMTTTGAPTALAESTIQAFCGQLRGELLRPGDGDYERARKVWNGMIDKHPALIARCTGVADVIAAVQFAREYDLLTAVRGGGHSLPGFSVCDDGLVIDLSRLKGIHVDPAQRLAIAQPGLTWGEFDRETQVFELASTGGVVSTTGIAGLTLGGGIGWLMRKYGLSCDHLRAVDIVTADGRFVTANAQENPDLFWGVRGGGGNFGIVTTFTYKLNPVGPVLAGLVIHPIARAREVLRFYRDFTPTAPDELTTYALLLTSPDGLPVVALACCYCGPIPTGEEVLRPLRQFGPPLADEIQPLAYCTWQSMLDAPFPPGLPNYYKSHYVETISDELIDVMIDAFARVPSPLSSMGFEQLGGAVRQTFAQETAFWHRTVPYDIAILGEWTDPATSAQNIQWVREVAAATAPFATGGVYVNFLGEDGEDQVKAAYGAHYQRLVALKRKYDPTNFFRLNQNIRPQA
jgi:FAD/FMN-containing dehydrogenase